MSKRLDNELLIGRQSTVAEARALYRMLSPEHTVEELRKLIVVPAWIERVLRDYAGEFPEDVCWISSCIKFRQAVVREFERSCAKALRSQTYRQSKKRS